jgi:methylated-DNA-protein-cysteine methyltransferase-like protein
MPSSRPTKKPFAPKRAKPKTAAKPAPTSRRSDAATSRLIRKHMSETYRRIHDVIVRIPRGHVMTYGDVAFAAGMPRAARIVGYALHAIGELVPWQRVVGRRNARTGHIAIKNAVGGARQRQLLEKEGVSFSRTAGIDLETYGWGASPRPPKPSRSKPRK